MTFDAQFLSTLRGLSPREAVEIRSAEAKPRRPALFEACNEISPADLYCYFHARFGPPNGLQSFLRENHSHNLVHWHWTVGHNDGLFDVQGTSYRTLFVVSGPGRLDSFKLCDLIAALKADFASHGTGMAECRKSLEHWTEFVSPYQRLRRSVEQLLEELSRMDLDKLSEPGSGSTDTGAGGGFSEEWTAAAETLNRAYGICFGIRSMLPVMAEAFVNLLMFVLMKREMRSDERLRDDAFRRPIDVRVRSLHIDCYGFSQAIDYSNPSCAQFHTLVNERNDLLHGNVSIRKLRFNDLYFLGTVPIFRSYRSMWERAFEVQRQSAGLPQIQDEFQVVLNFIEYILSCLDPTARANLEFLLSRLELGYNKKEDRVGVLFSEELIDFRFPASV